MLKRGCEADARVRASWTTIVGVAAAIGTPFVPPRSYPFVNARSPGRCGSRACPCGIGGCRLQPAARSGDPVRAGPRGQPGHAGLPELEALESGEGRLRRRSDPARHARRALELDEEDLHR